MEAQLGAVLERYREELHAIAGVTGTGIGWGDGAETIQLFVRSDADVENAQKRAGALLAETPVEVIIAGDAHAQ